MPLDHECPKGKACPLCNPTQEMLWWVHKLLPGLLAEESDACLNGLSYEEGHTRIRNMVAEHCRNKGLSGPFADDVTLILTYLIH